MMSLVVLALIAMVYSAPIQEDLFDKMAEGMVHNVAKRTDEQIFFGNQQNAPRVKKADPETDSRGLVRALPAGEIHEEAPVKEPAISEEPKPEVIDEPSEKEPEALPKLSENNEMLPESDSDKISNVDLPDEQTLKDDELLQAETAAEPAVDQTVPEEGGSGDIDGSTSDEMTYDELQKLYNEAGDRTPYDYYYPEYYLNYRKKRNTAMTSEFDSDVVKRNHRAKRDLGYDDLADAYFPSSFDEDEYYSNVMRKRAVAAAIDDAMARELAPFLEGYQTQEEYPERYEVPSYLEYLPDSGESFDQSPYVEDIWEPEDSFESLEREYETPSRQLYRSQPSKRQFLSMVPGSMRKRFNFSPYGGEGDHWGAFVESEKRGQEATYERLYRLARELATRRSPYTPYWPEDDYKKK